MKVIGKILKGIGVVLLVVLIAALAYAAYVFLSYYRIGDKELPVSNAVTESAETGKEMKLVSWNIGFGAYTQDFSFFMDGGTESWAKSKEDLDRNMTWIAEDLADEKADFYMVQEVDFDSTRAYHVDEREYMIRKLPGYSHTFAQNYDSPFLFYPFYQPHGASKSGLLTFSKYTITGAFRKEVPVESGFTKILDLDRCYSVNRVKLKAGNELVLYNVHLSAYTSDGKITSEQLRLLIKDMQNEYNRGNFCIAGGDFNKDMLGNSGEIFGTDYSGSSWAQPIPDEIFEGTGINKIVRFDPGHPVASCRTAGQPYTPGQCVLTVDGFLVSDNVKVTGSDVIDKEYMCSDHNPVYLKFILEE